MTTWMGQVEGGGAKCDSESGCFSQALGTHPAEQPWNYADPLVVWTHHCNTETVNKATPTLTDILHLTQVQNHVNQVQNLYIFGQVTLLTKTKMDDTSTCISMRTTKCLIFQ